MSGASERLNGDYFIVPEPSHSALRTYVRPNGNCSGPVGDVDTVKPERFVIDAAKYAITTVCIEGLNGA